MIVDCHTHIWTRVEKLGGGAREYLRRQSGRDEVTASPADHRLACGCVDRTLVFGICALDTGEPVTNETVADYVADSDGKAIGIAAVNPLKNGAAELAGELLDRDAFRGLTISPAIHGFHPADSRAERIYEVAADRGAPVFLCQGTHFPSSGRMEHGRPALLDEIAGEYPNLTLVIGSMGHPWVEECIALLGKHPRVFADVAGLIRRPWQAYNALVLAHQFNVMDKVLFGSDFPYYTPAEAIESLYRLHEVTQGTNLPTAPREALRSAIERKALEVLQIARSGDVAEDKADRDED